MDASGVITASPKEAANQPAKLIASLACLLPAWLAFAWLATRASWYWIHRPDLQFGWIVLVLCGYLFFERWPNRPAAVFQGNWMNGSMVTAAALLLFSIQVYRMAFGTTAAAICGLAVGILLVAFANLHYVYGGQGLRLFAFCFAFILVALPLPSILYNPIVLGLKSKIASANVELLNLMGIPAQQIGNLIQLSNGTLGIDEACSGIRSLQSTIMATLFIGALTLRSGLLKSGLLIIGIGLAILGNLIRSLFLSYTANVRGLEAVQTVHDTAGWSILAFTAVGVLAGAHLFSKLEARIHQVQELKKPR